MHPREVLSPHPRPSVLFLFLSLCPRSCPLAPTFPPASSRSSGGGRYWVLDLVLPILPYRLAPAIHLKSSCPRRWLRVLGRCSRGLPAPPPFPRIPLSSPLVVRWRVLAVLVVVVPLSLVFWSSSRCRVPHRHHRLPVVSGRPVAVSLPVVSPSLCSVVVVPVVPSSSSCPGAPCIIRWRVLAMLVVVTPLCLVFWSSSSVAPTVHRASSCSQRWGWVLGRLSLVCLHCPAAGPPVLPWSLALLSRCLPLAVVPVPLLPVSTPRAPARGCGWGYCAGGCHCRSSPSPVPRRPVVVAGRPLIVVPVSTQKRLLVTNR